MSLIRGNGGSSRSDDSIIELLQSPLDDKQDTISSSSRLNANLIGTGVISNTEFSHLNSIDSNIQDQIDDLEDDISSTTVKENTSSKIMVYPSTNPYWAFTTVSVGNYTVKFTLRDGNLEAQNTGSSNVYLALEREYISSASSSYGTLSSQASRFKLDTTATSATTLTDFNTSSYVKLNIIISAYGGTYKTPILCKFTATRHDSSDILCILESYTLKG